MAKQQKSYYGGYCLGPCLRKLRLKAGYSQKNVADLLNVSRSTYTYYETGKTSPDPFTLNRIARIFGVSMTDFFPPEEAAPLFLDDSGRRRSPKKVRENAWRIGDLTSPEREVIGYLRDKRISAKELLDELRRAYDNLPEDSDEKK